MRLRRQGGVGWTLFLAFLGMIILGMSGAITALGDTLVLTGGISPTENALVATFVELRIFHPMIAFAVGALVGLAAWTAMQRRPNATTQRIGRLIIGLYIVQLLAGSLNVALKAPVWLQMVHLALTSTIWILLVVLAAAALANHETEAIAESPPGATVGSSTPA